MISVESEQHLADSEPATEFVDNSFINAELVRLLYVNARFFLFTSALLAIIVAMMLREAVPLGVLAGWAGIILVVIAIQYWRVHQYTSRPPTIADTDQWKRQFYILSLLTAVGWGAAGYMLVGSDSFVHRALITFVAGAICAGAIPTLSPRLSLVVSYLLLVLVPLAVQLFFIGDQVHMAMASMVVLFSGLYLKTASDSHASTVRSLQLRYKNHDLVSDLASAKEDVESVNKQLRAEIEDKSRAQEELVKANELAEEANKQLRAEISDRTKAQEELLKAKETAEAANQRLRLEINDRTKAQEELLIAKEAAEVANERMRSEINDRIKVQQDLVEAKEAAEAAAKAKSEFLASMSHEIRTPMNGVLGMTEVLMNTKLTKKQQRFAETIQESGRALLSIINDILDFSKIEAGKLELQQDPFDLRALIEGLGEMFADAAHRKGLELTCSYPAADHTFFIGDNDRIRQVLTNLLGNALKFTKEGEVILRVTALEEEADSILLRFDVTDTGIGIPRDAQARIFESFSQADGSTTRTFGGTGLGLTISKQLVSMMQGEIGVESEVGSGSTFWFTASLPKADPDEFTQPLQMRGGLEGARVLVVDANKTSRQMILHILEAWQVKHGAAEDGDQTIRQLHEAAEQGTPYQVVFVDKKIPGMNSFQLVERVKKDPKIKDVRFVMLSPIVNLDETTRLILGGIETYLTKPVRQSDLYNCLVNVLDRAARPYGETDKPKAPSVSRFDARVLVAEDNPVNQEVVRIMLGALGCHVHVVQNGREAVESVTRAVDEEGFDLVLMDCQMPEMDGFKATAQLREWEEREGIDTRIPVIALTANVMEGDRERCLNAGMDDYLTKPFTQADLSGVLQQWAKPEAEGENVGVNIESAGPVESESGVAQAIGVAEETGDRQSDSNDKVAPAALDQAALQRISALQQEGADDIVVKVMRMYLENSPKLLQQIEEAVSSSDSDKLFSSAHSLKSSSATLGAEKLSVICKEMEELGRVKKVKDAAPRVNELKNEFEAVSVALADEMERRTA